MVPTIARVLSVEMIRNGGSLAAIFQDPRGLTYWLYFDLISQRLPDGVFERLGYETPVVFERQPSGMTNTAMNISWHHATVMLDRMRSLIEDEDSHARTESLRWLERMAETAQGEGRLPSGVARYLGGPGVTVPR